MERTALDAVRRVQSTAERAKNAAKRNPITSGTIALGTVGGLWFASQLLGSQSRTEPALTTLYTDDTCNETTLAQVLHKAKDLDAKSVDTPKDQEHFEGLMDNWTKAAALYSQAGKCDKAHYARGRLCYEGRGYVYDPEYGIQLYERAAFSSNGGGNKDAMYALACIALRLAHKKATGPGRPSFTEGDRRKYLYEAASLLRLAQDHEGARRTLSSFSDRLDPTRWIRNTREYITKAAEKNLSARSQIRDIAQYRPKNDFFDFARYDADVESDSEWRGWGQRVRRIDNLIDFFWITWSPTAHNAEVSKLIDDARSGKDMRQMASAGLVGLKYAKKAEEQSDLNVTTRIRKEAETMLQEAAINGDASAMMGRYDALRDIVWSSLYTQVEKEKASAEIKKVLDQGVRTGSREFLLARASYYADLAWHAEREGQRDAEGEHRKKARADLYQAADRGDWSALESYRGFELEGHNSKNRTHLEGRGVVVVPIPAALAMAVESATVVFSSEGSDANQTPGLMDLNVNMNKVNGGGVIVAKGDNRLRVTWPDMSKISEAEALEKLRGAYKTILSEVKTIISAVEEHPRVILEAIRHELFGQNDPYKLTARALLGAMESEKNIKVAFCVFAQPNVVLSYDEAFYRELGGTSDGDASDDGTSDDEDGGTSDGERGRPRHRVEQRGRGAEQGAL